MPDIIDLGGAPAEAECAQLGQTANFAAVNIFEVEVYRLAIIARYGAPPEGCRLAELANDHDFGTYRTLTLRVADDASPEALAYADTVEPGLGTWLEAGFAPPVTYAGKYAIIPRSDPVELVIGAPHVSARRRWPLRAARFRADPRQSHARLPRGRGNRTRAPDDSGRLLIP